MKKTMLCFCLLALSKGAYGNYIQNIERDANHFHPLPKIENQKLIMNPNNPLGELVGSSLSRFKCVIKTENGESFSLNSKQNSYQIGNQDQQKQYLTANIFSLQNGDYYTSLGVVSSDSLKDYESEILKPGSAEVLDLVEMVGKAISTLNPKVRFQGAEYSLRCS